MRLCLIPLKTELRNPPTNLKRLSDVFNTIKAKKPDLVCLPECTLTGYLYEKHDLRKYSEAIPGPTTRRMAALAKEHNILLCFGLIEREHGLFYNSAVLLDRNGRTILRHRKLCEKPPFAKGNRMFSVKTEFGRLGILICGDLFLDNIGQRIKSDTHLFLIPMSRSFTNRSPDEKRWLKEERSAYLKAVRKLGTAAAIVNALEVTGPHPAFGGSLLVSGRGQLLAESPHGSDRVLFFDYDIGKNSPA